MTADLSLSDAITDVVAWLFDDGSSLDADVEQAARLLLLDTLGCTIGGAAKPELRDLNAALAVFESGSVRLPGMSEGLTAPAAAGWCALAATWDEACEGLARAHGRPGLHAFPPAIALTLATEGTLGDALLALVRGYEVGGRLGERLRIRPGMHVDGTWGTFGAVAAAGSALGQNAETVMAGISAAACQTPMSLYLPVAQGATARNTYVAEAARRAINLVMQIGAGVTSPRGGLETTEEIGVYVGTDTTVAPRGEWLVTQGYLKPFAAVRHVHYGAEAARRWSEESKAPVAEIEDIELIVYPEALTYCGNRAPTTAIGAQFSLTYGVAHMLVEGSLGPDAYTAAALTHPETTRLEQLIAVTPRAGATPDQRYATLEIGTASGHRERIYVDRVLGDETNPMTVDHVSEKFIDYGNWIPASWNAEAVADAIITGSVDTPLAAALDGPA